MESDPNGGNEQEVPCSCLVPSRIILAGNCRWLRETSLDEIPQFLSVLTGEMSVVGPRPVEPDELAAYGKGVVEFLSVTPGITGWWQVTSRNDATYTDGQRQALELHYVRNCGVGLDLHVILGTFRAMFGKKRTGR